MAKPAAVQVDQVDTRTGNKKSRTQNHADSQNSMIARQKQAEQQQGEADTSTNQQSSATQASTNSWSARTSQAMDDMGLATANPTARKFNSAVNAQDAWNSTLSKRSQEASKGMQPIEMQSTAKQLQMQNEIDTLKRTVNELMLQSQFTPQGQFSGAWDFQR
jgi:hypothetical protein